MAKDIPKTITNEELAAFPADDEGNAQAVKALYGDELLFTDGYGWLFRDVTHWSREGGEARAHRAVTHALIVRRAAAAMLDTDGTNPVVSAAKPNRARVKNAAAQLADMLHTPISEFDNDPDLLNVANGVVNLRTGELEPHTPEQRFTYCLPVEYDPEADQSAWLRFLSGSVGGGDDVLDFLQEAIGYSLTGHTREERLFYIYGPPRGGKGTFTETILELMHKPLGAGVRFDMLTRDRSGDANSADLATLRPCRFVTASESSRYSGLNPAVIKSLTGGDRIYCALKFRDHFDYRPQFKVWLTSNWPVNTDVDDDAAWSRVHVLEFPNGHLGKEDKTLKERLRSPENLRGVLAWAIEGAMKWYARPNGLEPPEAVSLATERHRSQLDTVQQFIDECLSERPEHKLPNPRLYAAYEEWCKENGVPARKQRGLTQALERKGYQRDRTTINGKTQRVWLDVDLYSVEIEL